MSMSLFCEYKSRVISRIIFVFVHLLFDFIRFYTEIKKGKRNVNSLVPVKNFRHFKSLIRLRKLAKFRISVQEVFEIRSKLSHH